MGCVSRGGEIIVFLDGDLRGLDRGLIERLIAPIQENRADFVKARFSRDAGRVSTLTAKPLVETFFPELAHFAQPLGGIIAAHRGLLERLHFEADYGVDIALLIDAHFANARLVEVDIGHLEHDRQSLEALGEMAKQVARSVLHRADMHGRLSMRQIQKVEEGDRRAQAEFSIALKHLGGSKKLALFDMDGTLLRGRSVVTLAERTGRLAQVRRYLDNADLCPLERTRKIASCLEGIPRSEFVETARSMELSEGVVETIVALRKKGYRVGIVSDSFRITTEIVRRRVFADFSVANLLRFRHGHATGEVTLSPFLQHRLGCQEHSACKRNVLLDLEEVLGVHPSQVLAVGDSANDLCMLREAGVGVAFEPKHDEIHSSAKHVIGGDMRQLLSLGYLGQLVAASI